MSKQLIATLLFFVASIHAGATPLCSGDSRATGLQGLYAKDTIWEAIPTATEWGAIFKLKDLNGIVAVGVLKDQTINAVYGWHEGSGDICVKGSVGRLWVTTDVERQTGPAGDTFVVNQKPHWEGPFKRIGRGWDDEGSLYLERVLGRKCYKSTEAETWCVKAGTIAVDRKLFRAELVRDTIEMVNYGFPVWITAQGGSQQLWVFVRSGKGWNIYREPTDFEERLSKGRSKTPWKTLL